MVTWLIPPAKRGLPLLMSCKQRYESDGPRFSMYIRENECSSNTVTIIFIDFIPSNQLNPLDYANFKGMFGLFNYFSSCNQIKNYDNISPQKLLFGPTQSNSRAAQWIGTPILQLWKTFVNVSVSFILFISLPFYLLLLISLFPLSFHIHHHQFNQKPLPQSAHGRFSFLRSHIRSPSPRRRLRSPPFS